VLSVPRVDPVQFLLHHQAAPQVLWSSRNSEAVIAAVGEIASMKSMPELQNMQKTLESAPDGPRIFGGLAFDMDQAPDPDWAAFGPVRFVMPQFELIAEPDGTHLACQFFHPSPERMESSIREILDAFERLRLDSLPCDLPALPGLLSRRDHPDREDWSRMVQKAIEKFESNGLTKVVLARKTSFELTEALPPALLPGISMPQTPGLFHFSLVFERANAFIGATPERLYHRHGRQIQTEALAGTRPRGDSEQTDAAFADSLKSNEKELMEHREVVRFLQDVLAGLCSESRVLAHEELMRLAHVQHLYSRIQGVLREDVDDLLLLDRLHPTPAVGGSPRDLALRTIRELEPFCRGWYAGPVGWMSRDEAEFAVGIRSGLTHGKSLALFSGSGIVEGSEPEREWQENDAKLRHFLQLLIPRG
jgi:menaquinone-specific isochorismate synthase